MPLRQTPLQPYRPCWQASPWAVPAQSKKDQIPAIVQCSGQVTVLQGHTYHCWMLRMASASLSPDIQTVMDLAAWCDVQAAAACHVGITQQIPIRGRGWWQAKALTQQGLLHISWYSHGVHMRLLRHDGRLTWMVRSASRSPPRTWKATVGPLKPFSSRRVPFTCCSSQGCSFHSCIQVGS